MSTPRRAQPKRAQSRWNRASALQLAIRIHKAQLRELADLLPPDEFEAALDIFERMQRRERHRFARWKDAA
jgi:hypothetical protein